MLNLPSYISFVENVNTLFFIGRRVMEIVLFYVVFFFLQEPRATMDPSPSIRPTSSKQVNNIYMTGWRSLHSIIGPNLS